MAAVAILDYNFATPDHPRSLLLNLTLFF